MGALGRRAGASSAPDLRPEERLGWASLLFRQAARQRRFVTAVLVSGVAVGVAYRLLFDAASERSAANFVRSGIHGAGVALTVWAVLNAFRSGAHSRLGAALSRLPLAVEVVIRALVMTLALVVVGLTLQFLLYAEPYQLRWLTREWLTVELPRIVLLGFGMSMVVGTGTEIYRLIGGQLLTSVILGTYHRPARRQLIVMFLDLAHSTRLAEAMGEVKVHDLITRFFFDIDDPIADFGGAVHSYVGDEVIVTWPVSDDLERNARCVECFFAIEARMARLASQYERDFDVTPAFRAGLHAGPVVVSECGQMKRQLAYFGDTMNVAARLCDFCKTAGARLIVSGYLMRLMTAPAGLKVGEGKLIDIRGRESRVEAHTVSALEQGD